MTYWIPSDYPPELVQQVADLYASGASQVSIGRTTGLGQKKVCLLMKQHSIKARGFAGLRNQTGPNNVNWKGDGAGYEACHLRLYTLHGKPKQCSVCETTEAKAYEYANLTGNYADVNDYSPMCKSCHARFDKRHMNFKKGQLFEAAA